MLVDPRIITGAPAWLKPFKFAISTAIYSLTLAWIFGWLPDWPRVRRVVGWTTAIVFVLEVAIIDTQAWRGTTSHFNVSTPLNATLFVGHGRRDPAADAGERGGRRRAVAAAVRRPGARMGPASRHDAHHRRRADRPADDAPDGGAAGGRPRRSAHDDRRARTRSAASDGGPGVPVTGWSREHGDVRVPHFIGLHAIQALALVAVGLRRWRRPEAVRVRAVLAAAASYASLFLLLLWEALRGQSLVAPDAAALASIAIWAAVTVLVLGWIAVGSRRASRDGSDWMAV